MHSVYRFLNKTFQLRESAIIYATGHWALTQIPGRRSAISLLKHPDICDKLSVAVGDGWYKAIEGTDQQVTCVEAYGSVSYAIKHLRRTGSHASKPLCLDCIEHLPLVGSRPTNYDRNPSVKLIHDACVRFSRNYDFVGTTDTLTPNACGCCSQRVSTQPTILRCLT